MKTPLILAFITSLPTLALAQEQAASPPEAAPAPPAEPAGSVALPDVDQRLRITERKLELLEEEAAKKKAEAPVVTAGEKGFNLKSADGAFVVKLRGYMHADGREYFDDAELALRDTFLLRRARPILEATLWDVADFRLMTDFGNGTAVVQDAYVDLKPFSWLKLRGGKFKPPVGLERLQSATAMVFPERGLPTNLVPNRDIGFQLHGAVADGLFSYELGVFNGVVDGGSGDLDNNHAKDFAGRLFVQPFKYDPYHLLANLGVGLGASTGNQRGAAVSNGTVLPSYRSAGQNSFFSYASGTTPEAITFAKGRHTRLAPQAYYYYGSFGLLGEYVQSTQNVVKGAQNAELTHRSWQVYAQAVWGGKPLFDGVAVTQPLDVKKGTWGAVELAARYNELKLDDDTFPTFADDTRSARKARGVGAVVNWHWSKNIKLVVAFEHTEFDKGLRDGDRRPENVLFQRIQGAF